MAWAQKSFIQGNPRVYCHGTKATVRKIHCQRDKLNYHPGKTSCEHWGSFHGRPSNRMTQGRSEKEKGTKLGVWEINWRTRPMFQNAPSKWHPLHTAKASISESKSPFEVHGQFVCSACLHAYKHASVHPRTRTLSRLHCVRCAEGNKSRRWEDQDSSTRGGMSSQATEVQKLPWEGGQMKVGSQMEGVRWEWGMPRVLHTSPPHHEEYELFSWEWGL